MTPTPSITTSAMLAHLLLAAALLAPAAAGQDTTEDRACLTPTEVVVCATASAQPTLSCTLSETGTATCLPEATSRFAGASTVGAPGQAAAEIEATLTTCVGITCLIEAASAQAACSWAALSDGCQGTEALAFAPVHADLEPGACATVTLDLTVNVVAAPHQATQPVGASAEHVESVTEEVCA